MEGTIPSPGRRSHEPPSTRRSVRRRLNEQCQEDGGSHQELVRRIRAQLDILDSAFSSSEKSRESVKGAVGALSDLAKNDDLVDTIVECGAVPSLVRHLQAPPPLKEVDTDPIPYEHEVETASAYVLGLFASKTEHQQLIAGAGAIPHLVALLKRHTKNGLNSEAVNGVIRRAAEAITNLAHENSSIKSSIRAEGGIPPLVELLEFSDIKVQRAAVGALRTLAFRNNENKNQIVKCNALPTLILMLQSEDAAVQCEAVGAIGNLVHSSFNIKREVLAAGALQPVIGLLSSSCAESQRDAALLIGQFASPDSDCKAHIVQRGAVVPLIKLLQSRDIQLKEMSAFALGRLAQDTHNQAGIAHSGGGVQSLMKLLESKHKPLQHNAAYALYGLADNEDNVAELVRLGCVQKLQDCEFKAEHTRDCVAKTLKRLEEKIHGRVLSHLLYMMRVGEEHIQRLVVLALACLCSPDDHKNIFLDKNGLVLLLKLLGSTDANDQRDSSKALFKLASKVNSVSSSEAAPYQIGQLILGEELVNNSERSDVTFLVEGKRFYAHKNSLVASSEAFRAMFDGGYRERDATDIVIPNIRWDVFELMIRYTYTGSVEISLDVAEDLLRAADQYLLEGLKRLCEYTIAKGISVKNVSLLYELCEAFNTIYLRDACMLFILNNYDKLHATLWYPEMMEHVLPEIHNYFLRLLSRPVIVVKSCFA